MTSKLSVYKNFPQKEYELTDAKRSEYRRISYESRANKLLAEKGLSTQVHEVNKPQLSPNRLMPQLSVNNLRSLSLFSGGGGLDLGFDRTGFIHQGSYELIPICGETLLSNRPDWHIESGPSSGDVTSIEWHTFNGKVDVVHGGPPCQPFSIAGQQKGQEDERNMWGEFSRAVNTIKPQAFVAENVPGIKSPKFRDFVQKYILNELYPYHIRMFEMNAPDFGVPQIRRRVFFVGFLDIRAFQRFAVPEPTHSWQKFKTVNSKTSEYNLEIFSQNKLATMGVRESLGLPNIGYDNLAPTLRSGFTGKRNTTSILNSAAGQKAWGDLGIWPNGIQSTRSKASAFPAKNAHFRLSVQDCALLQGFPEDWHFSGAVYQILGQIGNSVCPPVAYSVAKAVAVALSHQ
jgi:DNA (cytosine-5)-methyltransferase 1